MMELPDYLEPFRLFSRPFPEAAVARVVSCREEATPHLLGVLERFPERWAAGEVEKDEMLLDYAMHLLAEFRESRAYRPLIRIARMAEADEILGDIIAGGLDKILAAVWDGDVKPLCELIGDPMADEYARASGLSALGVLFRGGHLERAQLLALLEAAYATNVEREPIIVWDTWAAMTADFGLEEELERVRALYDEGLADPGFEPLDSVEARLLERKDCESEPSQYACFTTASEEMGWWYCFTDAAAREEAAEPFEPRERVIGVDEDRAQSLQMPRRGPYVPPQPFKRESLKVGRNDPCPCGSGKKYKKCCSD